MLQINQFIVKILKKNCVSFYIVGLPIHNQILKQLREKTLNKKLILEIRNT